MLLRRRKMYINNNLGWDVCSHNFRISVYSRYTCYIEKELLNFFSIVFFSKEIDVIKSFLATVFLFVILNFSLCCLLVIQILKLNRSLNKPMNETLLLWRWIETIILQIIFYLFLNLGRNLNLPMKIDFLFSASVKQRCNKMKW